MSNKNIKKTSVTIKRDTNYPKRLILALSLVITLIVIGTISMICYNNYLYSGCTNPETRVNYEESLFDRASYQYIPENLTLDKLHFDPYGMENGIYTLYINNEPDPYQYQGGYIWQTQDKNIDTINEQTDFTDFSKREENIIASARELVCKYIQDSTVLTDKAYLIDRINTIPFYKYTDSTHPEIISVMDSPAVHMGIGIYCNKDFDKYFCEYMVVHELIHHIRYLTNGENILEERYYATAIDEGMADLITAIINPKFFNSEDYMSAYEVYYGPLLTYLSIFKEDALKAYFYGYENFFKEHGGNSFESEHHLFVVALGSYGTNYNTPWVCDTLFSTWDARYNTKG